MRARIAACLLGFLSLGWLAGCANERGYRCPTCGCAFNGDYATADGKVSAMTALNARKDEPRVLSSTAPRPVPPAPAPPGAPVVSLTRVSTAPEDMMRTAPAPVVSVPLARKEESPAPLPATPPPVFAAKMPVAPPTDAVVPEIAPLPPAPAKAAATSPPAAIKQSQTSGAQTLELTTKPLPPKVASAPSASKESSQVLTGEVQQWRKSWRLRYAAVDAEDAYGGSVQLEGIADASRLRDGQRVRVRGELVPPQTRQQPARFVVQGIEYLD